MFLDDRLYEQVKLKDIKKPEDFQVLVNELYQICERYFKPELSAGLTYQQVSQLMNRTFKLWDLFITKLEKENWFLVDVLKDYSYKKLYLSNPKLKELYDKGK